MIYGEVLKYNYRFVYCQISLVKFGIRMDHFDVFININRKTL